jgi:hypothetical protein
MADKQPNVVVSFWDNFGWRPCHASGDCASLL